MSTYATLSMAMIVEKTTTTKGDHALYGIQA
jgi:hypothetical protein